MAAQKAGEGVTLLLRRVMLVTRYQAVPISLGLADAPILVW
jgi:hypothetical protein